MKTINLSAEQVVVLRTLVDAAFMRDCERRRDLTHPATISWYDRNEARHIRERELQEVEDELIQLEVLLSKLV